MVEVISHEDFMWYLANCEVSFSIDEKDNKWLFNEALEEDRVIYRDGNRNRYLINYGGYGMAEANHWAAEL